MTFEELFSKTEYELGKTARSVEHVGNRPHSPMFIAVNPGFDTEAWGDVYYTLSRIWPQTARNLVSFQYRMSGNEPVFSEIGDSRTVEISGLQERLDQARMQGISFAAMSEWYVYNMIDTNAINSLEEFKAQYLLVNTLKDIVVDPARSILILLLNDSTAKRQLADEIRQYLAQENIYDSRIILATRDMSNVLHQQKELRRLAGDIMVISNNDAIGQYDDEDFVIRRGLFISRGTYTVSYVLNNNPNDKIALQITETMIDHMARDARREADSDLKTWTDVLGIKANRSDLCEDFLSGVQVNVSAEAFSSLPVRQEAIGEKIDYSTISYDKFAQYTFTDVFENFVAAFYKTRLSSYIRADECGAEIKRQILGKMPLAAIKKLNPALIDQIMDQVRPGNADSTNPLPKYFEDRLKQYIRKDLLYPEMKKALTELSQNAEMTENAITRVQQEFVAAKPPVSYADLGTIYSDACHAYLTNTAGVADMRNACAAGNDYDDILSGLYTCIMNLIRNNQSLFSMPLVDNWAARLKMAGTAIFKEIGNALVGDQKEHLLLHTRGAVDPQMKVYMLHTTDENGERPTDLYKYLQVAFASDPSVQFLNTGYDDSLEAIIFASVEGINIAL